MSDTQGTRKAVVTTAMVQLKVDLYAEVRGMIEGLPNAEKYEFDKGARGKGFALYGPQGDVISTFEGKEDALTYFNTWIGAANDVLNMQKARVEREASEKTAPAPRKVAAKVAKDSAEGDAKSA